MKRAPRGINLTFRKTAGRITLNVISKENIITVPIKIKMCCFLSLPFALKVFLIKILTPPKTSPATTNKNKNIPFATTVFDTEPSDDNWAILGKTRGVKVIAEVTATSGINKNLYIHGK